MIDDDRTVRDTLGVMLEQEGFRGDENFGCRRGRSLGLELAVHFGTDVNPVSLEWVRGGDGVRLDRRADPGRIVVEGDYFLEQGMPRAGGGVCRHEGRAGRKGDHPRVGAGRCPDGATPDVDNGRTVGVLVAGRRTRPPAIRRWAGVESLSYPTRLQRREVADALLRYFDGVAGCDVYRSGCTEVDGVQQVVRG